MSYHYFIADLENKILIDCGNVNISTIHEDLEVYKECRDYMNKIYNKDPIETPFTKLSVKELNKILTSYEHFYNLLNIQMKLIACEYWYLHHQDNRLCIIGEEELSKYKDYKIVY